MSDPFAPLNSSPSRKPKEPSAWQALLPAPENAPPPPEKHPKLGKPSLRWTYRDANGAVLGFVNRFDTEDGKQFRPLVLHRHTATGKLEWRWESWPAPRPLYGLDRLSTNPKATVIVTEGEKACDAASKLLADYVATSAPNGSKSAAKADWTPLYGRTVIIWPDADDAGQAFAHEAANCILKAGAASVHILNPPHGMEEGWDAADALAQGWNKVRIQALMEAAQELESKKPSNEPPPRKRAPAQRDSLMRLTEFCDLWHSPEGESFATIRVQGHRENWPIRSSRFKTWLSLEAYKEMGIAPGTQALEESLRVLEARACIEGPECEPWFRTGTKEGAIYIDMGDKEWRAIEVTAKGWGVLERHDLPFIRSASIKPLPVPEGGESIDFLRHFANTEDEDGFMLCVFWVLAALRGKGPYPILVISGGEGTSKSTFMTFLRFLCDPSQSKHRGIPKDERDLGIAAGKNLVLAYDNVSALSSEKSDWFCQTSTGSSFVTRTLHSDKEETIHKVCNPIIFNGIPEFCQQHTDLSNRALKVRLKPIPDAERQTERELWRTFDEAAPKIMGALLDGLSAGLRHIEGVDIKEKPRMADFAEWIVACAPGLGWEPEEALRAFMDNQKDAQEGAFEANPVAVAVYKLAKNCHPEQWRGTPTELLDALIPHVSENLRRNGKYWPVTAQGMSNKLERAASLLRSRNVYFERTHSGIRTITLWMQDTGS
jgi:putative DNA primase/helicase